MYQFLNTLRAIIKEIRFVRNLTKIYKYAILHYMQCKNDNFMFPYAFLLVLWYFKSLKYLISLFNKGESIFIE